MSFDRQIPTVAIVGRPNVGKSSLFNRLAGGNFAIVHDEPGITRDRLFAECRKGSRTFSIVDTGGIGEDLDDALTDRVRIEAEIAIETSDLILLVMDARAGVTTVDAELVKRLRGKGVKAILVLNKVDTPAQERLEGEFSRLGFENIALVSAAHGIGIGDLVDLIETQLPAVPETDTEGDSEEQELEPEYDEDGNVIPPPVKEKARPLKLAILGRPNAGKSSLVNAILEDERTIVSDIAGTTRDSVDVPYRRDGRDYVLIDTAGIRPQTKLKTHAEMFSVQRARKSIERADICLLVLDPISGFTMQDRKIAGLILQENKPCLIVVNKFDLYHPEIQLKTRVEVLQEEVGRDFFFLHYSPVVMVSAKERQFLGKIFQALRTIETSAQQGISTGTLNRVLKDAVKRNPPPQKGGKRFNLLYATRKPPVGDKPLVEAPHILLFCNRPKLLSQSYLRYLENRLREAAPFTGIPLIFTLKAKGAEE